MENTQNSPLIYKKIIEVMGKVPAVGKNKQNPQQKFMYRGIDQVMNALQNILPEVGIFYVPEVLESHREEHGKMNYTILKVKYTFYAADGSSVSAIVQSEGMDVVDKSSNKAMSGACKYALFQVFNIATEEFVDPDSETPGEDEQAQDQPKQTQQKTQAPQAFDEIGFLTNFPGLPADMIGAPMTAANAEKITDHEGVPYGMIPTEDLRHRLNALVGSIKRNGLSPDEKDQKKYKLGIINAILLDRKAHPEKRSAASK